MGIAFPALRSGPAPGGVRPVLQAAAVPALALGTVVAVVGAVRVPATVLLSAVLVSLLLLVLPAVTPPASAARPDTQRRTRRLLTAAAAAAPFVAGAHAAGVPPQLLSAAVLVAGSTVVGRWLVRWEEETDPVRRGPAPAHPVDAQQSPDGLADLLGVLPLEALFVEWEALRRAADDAPTGTDRDRLVEALRLLVTELHRRDPRAARRWLSQGPTEPPDRWFDDEPRGQAA